MDLYLCKETVAEYLTKAIKASGKKQTDISLEIGYKKPNIITMFKQGRTRLPLDKVGPLAKVLGVDARALFELTLAEYMPETLMALKPFMGFESLTPQESFLVETFRMATEGREQKYILFKPSWLKQDLIKA